uniref:Uncharacterized protein n=1 Tax=Vespula pensylvanica TaxID=30213 RepID=A0A834P7R4_VESPE|nr:hypothetical protein H0235_004692 [Vespula pensylvanica]
MYDSDRVTQLYWIALDVDRENYLRSDRDENGASFNFRISSYIVEIRGAKSKVKFQDVGNNEGTRIASSRLLCSRRSRRILARFSPQAASQANETTFPILFVSTIASNGSATEAPIGVAALIVTFGETLNRKIPVLDGSLSEQEKRIQRNAVFHKTI